MSTPMFPGIARIGDKVAEYSALRGMRPMLPGEIARLNEMSADEVKCALEGHRKVSSCAGIIKQFLESN